MNPTGFTSVLLFAPRPGAGGGVVEFTQTLERHLDPSFTTEQFVVGRRAGFFGTSLRVLVPLYDALRLARLLSVRRHHVYHVNPSLVPRAVLRDGLLLMIFRVFRRHNVLVFIHGWNDKCYRRIATSPHKRFLFRLAYGHSARMLVLASAFAEKLGLLGLDSARIRVITTMFDGTLLRQARRVRRGEDIWILFLARFVPEKGMYELLQSFKHVSERHRNAVLIMAGDGPERDRAQTWCATHDLADRVRFPGYVHGAEKAQLLVDSDIFALPSYHGEGCPVALLEAMGAGLPVLVTSVGGITDIVRNGANGIVLDSPEVSSLVAALLRLAANADLRKEMGRRNRDQAWRSYEARNVTGLIADEYRKLAAKT